MMAVASDIDHEVELKKFIQLPANWHQIEAELKCGYNQHQPHWPPTGADQQADKIQTIAENVCHLKHEPFQIIWQQLSFEVDEKLSEKLVNSLAGLLGLRNLPSNGWVQQNESFPDKQQKPTILHGSESRSHLTGDEYYLHSNSQKQQRRTIFSNINGFLKSGEVSAILGPSGSGKTSLLNAICGRQAGENNYSGSIRLASASKRRLRVSIIPQKDYLIENLTVYENLIFSSKILNANTDFDHHTNIMQIVEMLSLGSCLHSYASRISGGEYKRVSIAQELLKQPDVLILDEPTSGLDSLTCKRLVQSLVQLSKASRAGTIRQIAIVLTIHQPDIEVYNMFHHIYCLSKSGQVIFDGHPSDSLAVIQRHSGLLRQPTANDHERDHHQAHCQEPQSVAAVNPANLLIEIASEDTYGREPVLRLARLQRKRFELYLEQQQQHARRNSQWRTSLMTAHGLSNLQAEELDPTAHWSCSDSASTSSTSTGSIPSVGLENPATYKARSFVKDKRLHFKSDLTGKFWYHTKLLAQRTFISSLRDPLMTLLAFSFHLLIPFVMWIVYPRSIGSVNACPIVQYDMDILSLSSNRTLNTLASLHDQLGQSVECSTMFFITTYSFSMCAMSVAALAFPLNMHILLKEVRNGWYSLPAYVVAKIIANFPFEVLFPAISIILIYLSLDMPPSAYHWRLMAIAMVMILISMMSSAHGLIFGALCMDSVQSALFLTSGSTLVQSLLSGFTAKIHNMPLVLQKLAWLSMYRYSTDLVNMIRFGFNMCPCDESTNEYLSTKTPNLVDVPDRIKPTFSYFLTNPTSEPNQTELLDESGHILGINYDLILSQDERRQILDDVNSKQIDLFKQMAVLMSRSFSFGRKMDSCESYRSQLLFVAGTPGDDNFYMMLLTLIGLMMISRMLLFLVVQIMIMRRI